MLENGSHIVPVMVRDAELCKAASDLLLERHSIYIQPINYPTVAKGSERLRVTPTPRHTHAHIASLVESLVDVWQTLGIPFVEPPSHLHVEAKSDEKVQLSRDQTRGAVSGRGDGRYERAALTWVKPRLRTHKI